MDDREGHLAQLRDQIEGSVATHDPGGPDISSMATAAREQHDALRRAKEAEDVKKLNPSDRLRATIRNAVVQAKEKGPPKPKDFIPEMAAPKTWSKQAQAEWEGLPTSVRLASLRDQSRMQAALEPVGDVQRVYSEMHKFSKADPNMPAAEVLRHAYAWESALNGPNRAAAFAQLMAASDTNPHDVYAILQQAAAQGRYNLPQQQEYAQQQSDQPDPQILQTLNEFASNHAHFNRVRYHMGALMQEALNSNRDMTLQEAYDRACSYLGISERDDRKRAATSPRGRAPSAAGEPLERSKGIRSSIKNAVAEVRHREGRV